ncbi:hypothetical protein RN001_013715 [Aquatica leii]|uniref:Enkurin domain-containing protein n=1 Tax=Aquatica leii TaxID=1421715 RepID=A0AAN7Q026_9COLE|nr:hypothetical protein RN001_013715 [Aquatica leii]
MNSTTLRGVFPEQKPVCKRNFIKENMKYIKQMQGLIQDAEIVDAKSLQEKIKNKPLKVISRQNSLHKSQPVILQSTSQTQLTVASKAQKTDRKRSPDLPIPKLNLDRNKGEPLNIKPHLPMQLQSIEKYLHRGVQTDNPEDMQKLFKHGVIRYPSPSVLNAIAARKNAMAKDTNRDRGDNMGIADTDKIHENMHSLDINNKHNYIKGNILALKCQRGKHNESTEMKPQSYARGVIPKYLRDRKEEVAKEVDIDSECPDGHVLLPDEERKETLRVLRQSYADRIQELNSMPVRNDTLKMRKRKMALEEELKKIDEGIKVFQRPKVFVKINA